MELLGRSRELGALRQALDSRTPSLALVSGVRGGGKSALVRRVVQDYPHLLHVCAPLPEPAQRGRLAARLGGAPIPKDTGWPELFGALLHRAAGTERPFVLVLDDVHRLVESRARFIGPLIDVLGKAAGGEVPLHVVLVGPRELSGKLEEAVEAMPDTAPEFVEVHVPPLRFRAAAPFLPGRRPDDRLRAYGVFGGIPAVLQQLDPDVGVGTNVRRLLLSPDAPLADTGGVWLERDLQAPARYYAILSTLSRGEADWRTIHEGVPDLTRSGQVAPYLNKLVGLGLIETRRSVDASPSGRARRYAITDPFFAFWFRFILPHRLGAVGDPWSAGGDPPSSESAEGDDYARGIRPQIDTHMESILPMVCRQHMSRDALATLGAVGREGGSLWGPDYDLPVAGILTNGAAYFGACDWLSGRRGARPPLRRIEEGMRTSRYGFGRQHRLRLVFTGRPPPVELVREVARDPDARLIDAEALMG
ncbi:MAG: hypothetical protein HKO77_03625 [Gemmatimonadetes bacterium]|nr:hypothetical protein [Gemmatimonadota bacterium]NNL30082.1 hypothetical protein [Gemmatimonadota bacterium]